MFRARRSRSDPPVLGLESLETRSLTTSLAGLDPASTIPPRTLRPPVEQAAARPADAQAQGIIAILIGL